MEISALKRVFGASSALLPLVALLAPMAPLGCSSDSASGAGGEGGASSSTASSSSGEGGQGGGVDLCAGVTCDDPPGPACEGASVVTRAAHGTCVAGGCAYDRTTAPACTFGCVDGECLDDPCAGVTCDAPPAAACTGAVLRTYAEAGTCSAGVCAYAPTDRTCTDGCAAGGCVEDLCVGVTCDAAPPPACFGSSLRTFAAAGTCAAGACAYASSDASCPDGCADGACTGAAAIEPYPGVTPRRIDAGAAIALRVASDEAHVLVQRTLAEPDHDQGALAVISVASGVAVELTASCVVEQGLPKAGFSVDGAGLYFVEVSGTDKKLVVAKADGSAPRTLATGDVTSVALGGDVLVYVVGGVAFTVGLPDGAPVQLLSSVLAGDHLEPNATGTAVALSPGRSSTPFDLISVATGEAKPIAAGYPVLTQGAWSPDGAHFAYWEDLTGCGVVGADAAGASGSSTCKQPVFSPDGARAALPEVAGASVQSVTVRTFADDSSLVITPAAAWVPAVAFSNDNEWLIFKDADGEAKLGIVPATGGAFVDVPGIGPGGGLYDFALDHLRLAVVHDGREGAAVTTADAAAQILGAPIDVAPFWEPRAIDPGLLVFTSTAPDGPGVFGSLVLYPPSGAGAGVTLPGHASNDLRGPSNAHHRPYGWSAATSPALPQPFPWGWVGSEIVYEAYAADGSAMDVVAATDDAATAGVIAAGAELWTMRDGAEPKAVFFTHAAHDGVWTTALPQTAGR